MQVYQNTFFNSVASFERSERSAVGDHFGWHPSTGPDVEERHSHIFMNNIVAADESFKGPLVQFEQTRAVKDRLKDPQVKDLNGNVYVRRAGATPQPFIAWSPVQNESGRVDIWSLDELQKLQPKFYTKSQALPDFRGLLFRGMELGNFELLSASPVSDVGVPLPAHIRSLLNWKEGTFPGAYPPVR